MLAMWLDRDDATAWLALIGALLGVLAASAATWRALRHRWRKFSQMVDAALEVLVGTGEQPANPITGAPARDAVPGIGARVAKIEDALPALVDAVGRLADQTERLDDHDRRIKALELGAVERVVTKAESAAAFKAIEAVAKTAPLDLEN